MEAKYTSGPWVSQPHIWMDKGEIVKDMSHYSIMPPDSDHRLAKVEVWHWGRETAHVNAQLIAAATDLLAALQNLLNFLSCTGFSDVGSDEEMKEALAAIAKATGAPNDHH